MDLKINYIDAVECVKIMVNSKLNIARRKFIENRNQSNKEEYLELINDMKKVNLLDKKTIEKYLMK